MWSWTPTSSAPSFQPTAYPPMPHIPTPHTSFPASRLATPQTVFPSSQQNYYPTLATPNVGYSGGTLSLPSSWSAGQMRSQVMPEAYIQQQHEAAIVPSPAAITPGTPHHHGSLQSSFTPQEDSYQQSLFTRQQSLFQSPSGSQQQSSHMAVFQAGTPPQLHGGFHQQPHPLPSVDTHTSAFQSPPQRQFSTGSHHSYSRVPNIDKPPTSTSPFQPSHMIGGSVEARVPMDAQSGTLMHESGEGLGYTGHAQSNPFSVDFLLRDRPSNLPIDGEFTSEQQQSGYVPGFQSGPSGEQPLLEFDSQTEEGERPFSPPELVPMEMTSSKEETQPPPVNVQSHDSSHDQCRKSSDQNTQSHDQSLDKSAHSHNSITQSHDHPQEEAVHHVTASKTSDSFSDEEVCENKTGQFELADDAQTEGQSSTPKSPPRDESNNQSKNDKYISSLIRHQRNRGYESSDDDDVFLPNPVQKNSNVTMDTNDEPTREEDKPKATNENASLSTFPPPLVEDKPPVTVVIKRGRGTAKTLDLQKLQLPLSQGWRRLVRKRVGPDQIRVDICYIAPGGRRLRTFPEIQSHLDRMTDTQLTLNHFTFSKKVDLGEVLDGVIGEASPRGRRGRGRGKATKNDNSSVTTEGLSSLSSPMSSQQSGRGRGRGRGGRGRGGRPRKTAESTVRGEQSQLATHSARAPIPNSSDIGVPISDTNAHGQLTGSSTHGQLSDVKESQEANSDELRPKSSDTSVPGLALDGTAQGIGAVSQATAVALIQRAIQETNINIPDSQLNKEGSDPARLEDDSKSLSQEQLNKARGTPSLLVTQPSTTLDERSGDSEPSQTSEDSLAVLSSSAIATQVFSTSQPTTTSYEFHIHTPSSISSSLQGVGRGGGRGRGRKRKSLTQPSTCDPPPKRPRGRPKGSGTKIQAADGAIKKRRGRKPKILLPNTSHTLLQPLGPKDSVDMTTAGAKAPPIMMGGGGGTSVIVSTKDGAESLSLSAKEEKRRQLLLKARADKAKKKEVRSAQRSLSVNQRRLAQRQRRDREKQYWKQAKEREKQMMRQAMDHQEKISRQKELEDREMRRQTAYKQREVDNQQRARERTQRLLDHLKQQEIERSRSIYQQQLELEKMAQLKRPVEDLEVRQSSSLPLLPSLGWVQLPARAFADLLMVVEFARSFTEFLELEDEPSLPLLYLALYNHNEGRVLLTLASQLLKAVLYDPGTHALTTGGTPLNEVMVTPHTVSELLRLFLTHHSNTALKQITDALESSPLQSLRPSEKVCVLAHLVEQLLDCGLLAREVDTRMEQLASLRRDKWKISLKMKRFRSRLSAVYGVGDKPRPVAYSGRGRPPKRALLGVTGEVCDSSDEGDEGVEERGGVASDGEYSEELTDEETPEAKEALQLRLRALKKKFISVRKRIHAFSRLMRQFPLGQDRYARQYWVLPSVGGVIVEGVETSLDKNLQVIDTASRKALGVVKQPDDQSDCVKAADNMQCASECTTDQSDQLKGKSEQEAQDCAHNDFKVEIEKVEQTSNSEVKVQSEEVSTPNDEVEKINPQDEAMEVTPPRLSDQSAHSKMETDSTLPSVSTQQTGGIELPQQSEQSKDQSEGPLSEPKEIDQFLAPTTLKEDSPVPTPRQPSPKPLEGSDPLRSEEGVSLACNESLTGEESKDGTEEQISTVTEVSQRWFSLTAHHPCEVVQLAYQNSVAQQQHLIVAGNTPQYAYMTSDGQIIAAPSSGVVQQLGMSYGIIGNTLVQIPQTQYVTVDQSSVVGQQSSPLVQYAAVGSGEGVRYVTVGGTGYVAVGGGGQMIVPSESGNQVMVVQDQGGQQALVALPGQTQLLEQSGQQSLGETRVTSEVVAASSSESKVNKGPEAIKKEELTDDTSSVSSPRESDLQVREGEGVGQGGVVTVSGEQLASDRDQTTEQTQYVTAVVPGGPDGTPQYVSLPADPRVLSGQCSYAVLQQPNGSQQIVLVDNNTIGGYQGGGVGDSVMSLETPPPSMMDNEAEGERFVTSITLMYAQQPLPFMGTNVHEAKVATKEKGLRELLEEQHVDLTHGWWGVTRSQKMDRLLRSLCTRGVREKCLSKALQKNKDNINSVLNPNILSSFETSFRDHLTQSTAGKGSTNHTEEPSTEQESSSVEVKTETVSLEVKSGTEAGPSTNQNGVELCDGGDHPFPDYCLRTLLSVAKYLDDMQGRLITANLHNEGVERWDDLRSKISSLGHTPQSLTIVSEGLLELERSISRANLKPPLRDKKLYLEEQERTKDSKSRQKKDRSSLVVRRDSTQLELPSEHLLSWREAVGVAMSSSQLAVCMSELEDCIAWEKSNTIVFCQVCHGGENESLLLLCDRCDRGTHTYCCEPKLSIVPEGDWFCRECVTSHSKYRPCFVCDSKRGLMISCAVCPRNYHKRCLNPPLNKIPPSPWKCPNCKNKPIPKSRQRDDNHSTRKRDKAAKNNEDMCHTLLKELESHDDAWPFLAPVERKKFPAYYKVIKQPMDLQTMRDRLDEGRYADDVELFAADARLIFSNCTYYNEDDSEIGSAGHAMSDFFEKRWSKLTES